MTEEKIDRGKNCSERNEIGGKNARNKMPRVAKKLPGEKELDPKDLVILIKFKKEYQKHNTSFKKLT